MNHYVLTRSAYPASYPLEANRRRLELTRHVTARSLAAQGERRWRWMVAIDPSDPLLEERKEVLASAGVPVVLVPVSQQRDASEIVPDGRLIADVETPGGPWRRAIAADAPEGRIVTTRLDDDDALSVDALRRIRARVVASEPTEPTAWVLPAGYKCHRGRVQSMTHLANMFCTLDSPGDLHVVMEAKHGSIRRSFPTRYLDRAPGWLWVRHADTRSGARSASRTLRPEVSGLFDVDWAWLRGVA